MKNKTKSSKSVIYYGKIPCNLSQGMFGNEYAVEVELSDGKIVSFFADKGLVETNDSKESGYIKVSVVLCGEGTSKILLPSEAFESGTRWVEVPKGRLQPA